MSAAGELFRARADRLAELIAESNRRLHPLTDPLTEDFGTHRWLAADREEAYSDWLEWIVRRVGTPQNVIRLFGISADCSAWGACKVEIGRELTVPSGHVDRTGRLDLWLRIAGQAIVVIEIKKYGADQADTVKHTGYRQWMVTQFEPFKDAVLIAARGDDESYDGFRLLTWDRLCATLRRMVPELYADGQVVTAAMVLAFVGAVEQNLLGYSAAAVDTIRNGRATTFNTEVVAYIEQFMAPEEQ